MSEEPVVSPVGAKVYGWIDSSTRGALSKLDSLFPDATRLYVVGGAVRDFFLGGKRVPADLDVTVEGVAGTDLARTPGVKINAFGGPMIEVGDLWVDIWALEDTQRLKEYNLPININGVLGRFVFNLERIALEAKEKRVVNRGCLEGIANRCIDYDPVKPKDEAIQAARLVILHHKTEFDYSPRAINLLVRAKEMIQDPNVWVEVVKFFHSSGKYLNVIDSIRQEILSQPNLGSNSQGGGQYKGVMDSHE